MPTAKIFPALFLLFLTAIAPSFSQVMVKDINPGSANSLVGSYQEIIKVNNLLYFPAANGTHGQELWKSNGVTNGTSLVIDLNPAPGQGSNPAQLTAIGTRLFFVADNGTNGRELWVINGTSAPQMLELEPGAAAPTIIRSLIAVGSDVYFLATTPSHGGELWKYDGVNPPQAIEAFAGATGTDPVYLSYGNEHIWGHWDELAYEAVSNTLYWFGTLNTSPQHLWKYTPGQAAPVPVGPFQSANPHLQPPVPLNGYVYFPAYAGAAFQNYEMFRSAGTTIDLFHEFMPGSADGFPVHLTLFNGSLYFLASDPGAPFNRQSIGKIKNDHSIVFPLNVPAFIGAYQSDGFPDDNPFRIIGNQMHVQKNTEVWILNSTGLNFNGPKLSNFFAGINESGLIKSGTKYFYSRYENDDHPQVIKDAGLGPVTVTTFDGNCHCTLRPFVLRGGMLFFSATTLSGGWELWKINPSQILLAPEPASATREAARENMPELATPFVLSPNPADASCALRFATPTTEAFNVTVVDNAGKEVLATVLPDGVSEYLLPTADLPKGLYFIQLRGSMTDRTYHDRLVVSH